MAPALPLKNDTDNSHNTALSKISKINTLKCMLFKIFVIFNNIFIHNINFIHGYDPEFANLRYLAVNHSHYCLRNARTQGTVTDQAN